MKHLTRQYLPLVLGTIILTYLVIVLGAATRVADAGMSCPDWPHCYGLWWPFTPEHIANGFAGDRLYQWWEVALEWSHRLAAALSGFALIGLIIASGLIRTGVYRPLIVAVILLAIQIKLGAVTVWMNNIHWSVVLHLGNAMLFLASLVWLYQRVKWPVSKLDRVVDPAPASVKVVAVVMALLVWATMLIGAFVSSSHAGGVCGGLFDCAGQWLPKDTGQHMHMQHRFFALATFAFSIFAMVFVKKTYPAARKAAVLVHNMAVGQAALGIATLYSFSLYPQFYMALSLAHLAWGTLLFLSAVGLVLRVTRR
jgi:heme a synthase